MTLALARFHMAFAPVAARPAAVLLFAGIVLAFSLSSLTLSALGIAYDAPGGNALHKLHPSTPLLCAAAAAHLFWRRDCVAALARLPATFPGATLFVCAWLLLAAYIVVWLKTPIMPIVDTFVPAVAALLLFEDLDEDVKKTVRFFLHGFLFANACIGIAEYALQMRLTPFVVGGAAIVYDVRLTALLGHPLTNAATSGVYVLALFFGGDRHLAPGLRALLIAMQLIAMIPFGGRTAMVITYAIIGAGALVRALLSAARDELRPAHWLALVVALPAIGAAVAGIVLSGAIDKILERFTDDAGSADARLVLFELFDMFSLQDILFGPDPERLAWAQWLLGIPYGIENSWLGLVFQYGALVAGILIAGIFCLWADIFARTGWRAAACFVLLFVLVTSAASLSVKSIQLTQFAIIVLALFDRPSRRLS